MGMHFYGNSSMQVTDNFARVELSKITVPRDSRQRRDVYSPEGEFINSDGLLDSIRLHGVLQPVIVDENFVLRGGGERRLEASRTLGLSDIPVRFVADLTREEAEELELTENLQRRELPWRDEVRAIARLHGLYCERDSEWTLTQTAERIHYGQLNIVLRVARDLDHPSIAQCTSVRQAWNVLSRRDDRERSDVLTEIMESGGGVLDWADEGSASPRSSETGQTGEAAEGDLDSVLLPGTGAGPVAPTEGTGNGGVSPAVTLPPPEAAQPPQSVLNVSFLEWAPSYTGPKFNFVHCDFPYGIEAFSGPMSGRDRHEVYDDSASTYWALCEAFCANLDRFMAPSAHLMFWLPADVQAQAETLAFFARHAPGLEFWPKPLVWHKTDNVGVLSDPKRKPRHVYETALVAARDDRLLVRATSDCYGSGTDKQWHPSTKPEPMLRYFFSLFVDEFSSVLDPTCGGGSALRAAESLSARRVLGLEVSPEHAANATKALKLFRAKAAAARSTETL